MPVGAYAPNKSTGNGVTTVFPYTFRILDSTHLVVTVDGATAIGYTVSGVGAANGGNVTFSTPPANGAVVIRSRAVPYTRTVDYQANGDFREDVLDADQDVQTMQVQQVAEAQGRSLAFAVGSPNSGVIVGDLIADKYLKVNATADGIDLVDLVASGVLAVSAYIQTLLDDANAAAARATLGAGAVGGSVFIAATAAAALAAIGAPSALQAQTYTAFTTGGNSTAYTLTPAPALSALAAGDRFRVKFHATNGATPTMNISTLGAVALKVYDSAGAKQAPAIGALVASMLADVEYDGVDLVVLNQLPQLITLPGAPVAASGTAVDFTNIPAWAKRVTISVSGLSTSGTSNYLVRLGTSGGVQATGYVNGYINSSGSGAGTAAGSSTGFSVAVPVANTATYSGQITLTLMDAANGIWSLSSNVFDPVTVWCTACAGTKSLGGVLDRIRVTTVNGTDTFDAGSINISYEG